MCKVEPAVLTTLKQKRKSTCLQAVAQRNTWDTNQLHSDIPQCKIVGWFLWCGFFAPYIEKQRCKYTYMLSHIYLYIYKHIYKDMRIHTCINTVTHGAIPPNPENVDFLFLDNVRNLFSKICWGYARITLLIKDILSSHHRNHNITQPKLIITTERQRIVCSALGTNVYFRVPHPLICC